MSDIDLKEVNEFQGNALQCHCYFMYHLNSGGNVADFFFFNGMVTRTTKATAIWQIVLFSNSEGQSEVFYITSHNCLIL